METFRQRVIAFVKKVPKGKVVSYGQVAAFCSHPRAARQVGGVLRSLDIDDGLFRGPQISRREISKGNLGKGAKFQRPKRVKGLLREQAAGTIVPWWRVVNNKGLISIKGNWTATKELQKSLLMKEGVKVEKDFSLDIEKYRLRS